MARQARKTDLKWTDDATSFFLFFSFCLNFPSIYLISFLCFILW